MPEPLAEIRAFLDNWKPFTSLPSTDPLRREMVLLLAAPSPAQRHEILLRVNPLYRLHRTYDELGILRDSENAKMATFAQLLNLDAARFAQAIREQKQKPFLTLLLEGFEFDRAEIPGNQLAARAFLAHFWGMRVGDPAIKYGLYPNSLIYSAGGKTHDLLAREFTERGLGSGMPVSAGFISRQEPLAFTYDTYSQFVKAGGQRQAVADAIRRWIRLTGADDARVKLAYAEHAE